MFFVIEAKIQFVFGMHDRSQLFGVNNPKCICSKCKNSEVFSYKLPLQRHLRKGNILRPLYLPRVDSSDLSL